MKTLMVLLVLGLTACRDSTAPQKPCTPNFSNADSSKVVRDSAGNVILKVAWCGPITVTAVNP